MARRIARLIVHGIILLSTCAATVSAQSTDSLRVVRRGISFSFQCAPHFSSPTSFQRGGYLVSIGVGYMICPDFTTGIAFFSGREENPHPPQVQIPGMFDVGGVELQVQYFLSKEKTLQPFVCAGCGLFTMLDGGKGYNGGGPHGEIGVRLNLSSYVAIDVAGQYRRLWMHNVVADGNSAALYDPFTDTMVAVTIGLTFFPNIYP